MTISRSPPPPDAALLSAGTGLASSESSSADALACLSADDILELLLGVLSEAKRDEALEHIAACEDCRVMFSCAAQALEDTGPADAPLPAGVFQSGMVVAQRYHVDRFLARGGMGEVYVVRDQVLNERVALKTVRSRVATSAKAILRLKSEALLSRRIGHPHTCRIFEFGEHRLNSGDVVCFLTMELVEGETLGERLRREGSLPVEQVRLLVRQLLGGLSEAHGLGIVHRDLKSDNVMLRSPATGGLAVDAVIMDFGLALRMDAEDRLTTDSQALVGSAAYMAPEQVEGERLTPSTDVYAFGIILFEMLTGQLPFRAATPASTALLRLHSPPPPPSSVRPELATYWDELVLGCMERTVERRFPSAREVLAAFEHPPSVVLPLARRPSRVLAGALVVLAVLTVSASSLFLAGVLRIPNRQLEMARQEVSLQPKTRERPPRAELAVVVPLPPATPSSAPKKTLTEPAGASRVPGHEHASTRGHRSRVNAASKAPPGGVKTVALPPLGSLPAAAPTRVASPAAPEAAPVSSPALAPSPLEPLPLDPELPE